MLRLAGSLKLGRVPNGLTVFYVPLGLKPILLGLAFLPWHAALAALPSASPASVQASFCRQKISPVPHRYNGDDNRH